MESRKTMTAVSVGALMMLLGGPVLAQGGAAGESPAVTGQAGDQQRKISLVAGHNVVDAVDDVRETVSDLAQAMINATETAEFAAWQPITGPLQQTIAQLDTMEQRLDQKAEATDSSWLNWMEDRDYSVTVKQQIEELGETLNQMAGLLAETDGQPGLQVITGHNLVDQVDDVRETIGDLYNAINNAGPELGWFDEDPLFEEQQARLNAMEETLDQKAEQTDEEWAEWVGGTDYEVYVRNQIETLGQMLNELSASIQA